MLAVVAVLQLTWRNPMLKKLLGEHVGVIFSLIFAMLSVALAFGAAQQRIDENRRDIHSIEERHRDDHDILVTIERDVRWIREKLKPQDK